MGHSREWVWWCFFGNPRHYFKKWNGVLLGKGLALLQWERRCSQRVTQEPLGKLGDVTVACTSAVRLVFQGTLTQNEMVFKRLHLGTVAYGLDSMDEVQSHIFSVYTQVKPSVQPSGGCFTFPHSIVWAGCFKFR